jgi:hypothetical protein
MEENQVPASTPPQIPQIPEGYISPEILEQLKAQARAQAIQATLNQSVPPATVRPAPRPTPAPDRVVYVRRNLTVAELIVVFMLSCGLVLGIQGSWHLANNLPRIEVQWNK